MKTIRMRFALAFAAACGLVVTTSGVAQTSEPQETGGTILSGFAGGAHASSASGPAAGLGVGWEVTPRIALEGQGRWFGAPMGETTFAASLAARYSLSVFDTATPYVSAGVGMFQATFDRGWKAAPAFYRDRVDSDVATGRRVFRDVLWSVGAGADLIVSTHLALRPDVSLLIVTTRRDARVVPVYGLHLAYYFVPRDRAN